jgi:hypothetical protein
MCPKCQGFAERTNFREPWEYRDLARQLIEIVGHGTFRIVKASCPLEDLFKSPWPGDVLTHEFECFSCGQGFSLSADTYHGHGSWEPDSKPPTTNPTVQ